MKNKINFLIVIALFCYSFILAGCGLQAAVAVAEYGLYAASAISGTVDSLSYGDIEEQKVGKYTIKVVKCKYLGEPAVIFTAYNAEGQITESICYNEDDLKSVDKYLKMSEPEKKIFIREAFLKYASIDLDPAQKKVVTESPATFQNIPTTGFAPTVPTN